MRFQISDFKFQLSEWAQSKNPIDAFIAQRLALGKKIMVREIPAMMGGAAVGDMIKQIAADLTDMDGSIEIEKNLWKICSSMACYGSVRSGRILNHAEMNALLRQMEQTPLSGQCNHGRPTYVELKKNDIERLFGRR